MRHYCHYCHYCRYCRYCDEKISDSDPCPDHGAQAARLETRRYEPGSVEQLLLVISKVKDACESYDRMEVSGDAAVDQITRLAAPVDTTPVE
ncbi:hypothetical protein [Streptomyces sp. NBC_00470]|uniref:hypothetical protein n=1 Tax=Streptomyces sp. NBC_00470 TaxID=2975753 RepID=UPI002F909EC7